VQIQNRIWMLIGVMIVVAAGTSGTILWTMYEDHLDDERAALLVSAQSQARLIEAMDAFDSQYGMEAVPGSAFAAILTQFRDAHERYGGFGATGEFTLARLDGDEIVFLLTHREQGLRDRTALPLSTELAEPMRRALSGESGTLTGLDYRGETVIAAFDPVDIPGMTLGIVAKVDLAEVRGPFARAGFMSLGGSFLLVLAGILVFGRIGSPLIKTLEESEERFRTMFSEAPLGIALIDSSTGRIYEVNHRFAEIVGRTREEMASIDWMSITHPDDVQEDVDNMARLNAGEIAGFDMQKRYLLPDGAHVWVNMTIAPVGIGDTGGPRHLCMIEDITDRLTAEQARVRLTGQLRSKNEELEQVIYVASHDLRSPIVNIAGYSKELERTVEALRSSLEGNAGHTEPVATMLAEDIPEALHFIGSSVAKMDTLLTGLLKLSRLGRAALTIDSLDMNGVMAQVVDSSEFQIRASDVQVDVAELPSCIGDAVQVGQVFSNLLDNALKYLDPERPGEIRISGSVEGERAVYCVEDNGIGIARAHRKRIFEIFHQSDPASSEGDGLGLTIVQRCLSRLSGETWVESTPGEGSRFYVALPAAQHF
jgi:two-component system, chemotaxis family, sensor kinase Cph1